MIIRQRLKAPWRIEPEPVKENNVSKNSTNTTYSIVDSDTSIIDRIMKEVTSLAYIGCIRIYAIYLHIEDWHCFAKECYTTSHMHMHSTCAGGEPSIQIGTPLGAAYVRSSPCIIKGTILVVE